MRLGILLGFGPGAALGVGRFAYALVLPAMQLALGLSYTEAGIVGSANTAGYFLGALISHRVLYATGYRRGFYASLLIQTLSLALLAFTSSFGLLFILRFIQGVFGAFIFVGGAALLLASGGRATASGLYFSGVGLGILLSPVVLPFAANWQQSWLYLAVLSLLMSLISLMVVRKLSEPAARSIGSGAKLSSIRLVLVAYGLYGAGYIGYMTFVTTGLNVAMGTFWLVLGIGASLTGLTWGPLIERIGGYRGLIFVLLVLTLGSLYPLVIRLPWLSAFMFGISFLGVITAITDLFRRRLPPGAWARAMGLSTSAFAAGQALGPSLSGFTGELFGGSVGALGMSTALLALALAFSLYEGSSASSAQI